MGEFCLHSTLQEIPSSIGNLKRLKFLDLNVNNLNHVPSTIGGCESLGVLSLRHNAIRDLPMEVGRLSRLQVLDLIENNLVHLPYTLTVLYQSKTLCALWLSFNQPPLPKLSVANEPVMNVKVLTCYLLPQKGVTQLPPPKGIFGNFLKIFIQIFLLAYCFLQKNFLEKKTSILNKNSLKYKKGNFYFETFIMENFLACQKLKLNF